MNLPNLESIDVNGKCVFVRASLDVPMENGNIKDTTRLEKFLPTLLKLKEKGARRITIAGHIGRPDGDFSQELSTKNLIEWFKTNLQEDVYFIPFMHMDNLGECPVVFDDEPHRFYLMENLRFWKEEEENSEELAEKLHSFSDVFVNDAFDASHREHTSIVQMPKLMPSAFGDQFIQEYTNLVKVLEEPKKPVISLFSGLKRDKLDYLEKFTKFSDLVLVSGRLPEYFDDEMINRYGDKIYLANLIQDKEDITLHSVEKFEEEITKAGTIIVSGPVGKFEDEGHRQGTERVFKAVVENRQAFKLAGGGDTNSAIDLLGLRSGFDWVSIAGGAMLDFLANGTLPGIESVASE